MIRYDWRCRPQERSPEPPEDDEENDAEREARGRTEARREDEEIDRWQEERHRGVILADTNNMEVKE
jgi:hypothetical protein